MSDDLIEEIANAVETHDILDITGIWAKKKKDRELANIRTEARHDLKRELGDYIRSFKSDQGNNPLMVLREIAEGEVTDNEYSGVARLSRAWPLAWRGLCDIFVTIKCNCNTIPPESRYRVVLTEKGRKFLAEAGQTVQEAVHEEAGK